MGVLTNGTRAPSPGDLFLLPPPSYVGRRTQPRRKREDSQKPDDRNTRLSLRLRRECLRSLDRRGGWGVHTNGAQAPSPGDLSLLPPPSYLRPPTSGAGTNLGASGRTAKAGGLTKSGRTGHYGGRPWSKRLPHSLIRVWKTPNT
jgi:hypothetical protein